MMANRSIVTTKSTKNAVSDSPAKKVTKRRVTVLMGDHRRIDTVKPNGTFDEDDFHAIAELKKALAAQTDFQISYLNDHDALLMEINQLTYQADFVLNLCDEGFNNEATKVLHIPALLEIFDTPYSGGSPQCLAYCYDKSIVRGIAEEMQIPVPAAFSVSPEEPTFITSPLEFPVIVKPNFGDSRVGITADNVCYNVHHLEQAIKNVRDIVGYSQPVLVEDFLKGKDISVGIIGNSPENYLKRCINN